MPKNIKPPKNQTETEELTLREIKFQNSKLPKPAIIATSVILILLALSALFLFKSKSPASKKTSQTTSTQKKNESTQESQLRTIYEKKENIPLAGITPRYSIYEDSTAGYRFAYPVGFNASPTANQVEIVPTTGAGKIILSTSPSLSVTVQTAGATPKQVEFLNSSADFIKNSFQFIKPTSYDKNQLQQRFSQGNNNLGKY